MESQFSDPTDIRKHLISSQTRQDINSTLMGFLKIVERTCNLDISITPGYFNSDLIENWFCQLRGVRGGLANHPTISQIGPAQNTNLLTGNMISSKSKKSNAGGEGFKSKPSLPPKKKDEEKVSYLKTYDFPTPACPITRTPEWPSATKWTTFF